MAIHGTWVCISVHEVFKCWQACPGALLAMQSKLLLAIAVVTLA